MTKNSDENRIISFFKWFNGFFFGALLVLIQFKMTRGRLIVTFANYICIGATVYFAYFIIKKIIFIVRKKGKQCTLSFGKDREVLFIPIIICATIVSVFCSSFFMDLINYHRLHLEPYGDNYRYIVFVKNEKGEKYTATGIVSVNEETELESHYNIFRFDYDEYGKSSKQFLLSSFSFDSSNRIDFDDCVVFSNIGEKTEATDTNGNIWSITLTDKPANTYQGTVPIKKVIETIFVFFLFPTGSIVYYCLQEKSNRRPKGSYYG